MAASVGVKRLTKEYEKLLKEPIDNIIARPDNSNILQWHFIITGAKDTPFEGGQYYGLLIFPKEYPMKPPEIRMVTPNGRFQPNQALCLNISSFHPETWNPLFSVGSIIVGLYSIMSDFTIYGAGFIYATKPDIAAIQQFAKASVASNKKNEKFCNIFPDIVNPESVASDRAFASMGK